MTEPLEDIANKAPKLSVGRHYAHDMLEGHYGLEMAEPLVQARYRGEVIIYFRNTEVFAFEPSGHYLKLRFAYRGSKTMNEVLDMVDKPPAGYAKRAFRIRLDSQEEHDDAS